MEQLNSEKLIITAGVIIVYNGKLLLVKRPPDKKLFPNSWTFPGGKLEEGESLSDCAERECFEEAGISPFELIAHSIHEFEIGGNRTLSHLFLAKASSPVVESDDVRWFSLEDLRNINIAFDYKGFMISLLIDASKIK